VTLLESESLLQDVFRELLASAGEGWASLELTVMGLGARTSFSAVATAGDGSESTPRLSTDGAMACLTLRKVMYRPGSGTWYTARFTVDTTKQCHTNYDYESEPIDPDFQETVDDIRDELIEDQEMFPRDQEHLPGWHPCRAPS
jgi:hypothetical protein